MNPLKQILLGIAATLGAFIVFVSMGVLIHVAIHTLDRIITWMDAPHAEAKS